MDSGLELNQSENFRWIFKPRGKANLFPRYKLWDLDLEATGSHASHYMEGVRMQCERTRKAEMNGETVLAASGPMCLIC